MLSYYYIFNPYLGKKFVNSKIDRNSPWYVNDLYMSDQYYYETILNDAEKELYTQLFKDFNAIKTEILVKSDEISMNRVIDAIQLDHPEMINLTTYSYSYGSNGIVLKPKYITKSNFKLNRMIAKIQKNITKIEKATRNMSEYEKEKYIYEWMGKNNRYRKDNFRDSDQSAYTALVKSKNTVCAGFGKGSQILFQNVGLESYILLSDTHIWNLVKIDGDYYYYDATNTYVPNCYKTVSYSGLNTDYYSDPRYNILHPANLPFPNGTQYLYYIYNRLIVNDFEDLERIIKATDEKREFIEFKTVSKDMDTYFSLIKSHKDRLESLGLSTNSAAWLGNGVGRIERHF